MRNLLIVFLVLTLIFMLLFCPFKIRLMSHFNMLKKKGFYSLKVLKIKLLCGRAYLNKNNQLVVENSINIMKSHKSKDFILTFAKNFVSKINVKKIEIFFTGGMQNDSYSSAILCGVMSASVETLYSVLSQKYDNVHLYEDIPPTFNTGSFELTLDVVIQINLVGLMVSLVKASLSGDKFKEMKNEGRL